MCDTGASTQRLHAHLAWREGPRSKSGEGRDSAHGTSHPRCPTWSRSCWQRAPSFSMELQKVLAVSPADMPGPGPRGGGTARPLSTASA